MARKPKLYYVSPEWDSSGRLTRHSLLWNPLDGRGAEIETWKQVFRSFEPQLKNWNTAACILEQSDDTADFLFACRVTLAISERGWKSVADLVANTVERLPIRIERSFKPTEFVTPRLPAKHKLQFALLHATKNVPIRFGQSTYWAVDKSRYVICYGGPKGLQKLCLDSIDLKGKDFFSLNGEWIATEAFVERYRAKKLTGLQFFPIDYELESRATAFVPKRQFALPKQPDFRKARKGWFPEFGDQCREFWQWTYDAFRNLERMPKKPIVGKPVPISEIQAFEKKHKITLPNDYRRAMTEFAGSVTIEWSQKTKSGAASEHYDELCERLDFMFGLRYELWSFERTAADFASHRDFVERMIGENPGSKYELESRNKLPVTHIDNGDLIAQDLQTGEIVYLSHDGDTSLHGQRLAKSFAEFVLRWSWIGTISPDYISQTPFYDSKKQLLGEPSNALTTWHNWLCGMPFETKE